MLKALVIAAILLFGQKPEQTGRITGIVVTAPQQQISQPVQVILLSPRYTNLWDTEVQRRLDFYWERFKPTFRTRKEYFIEFSKQAHRDATNYIVSRMRRDRSGNAPDYLQETSAGGTFEFRNVPFGEYKVLAVGKIAGQDAMWQEFVDVRSPIPQFLEVKKRVP